MIIGIIGNGFVGKATRLLECATVKVMVYDIVPELCVPLGTTLKDFSTCDIVFVAVPTPMGKSGECHTHIVERVVEDVKREIDSSKTHIVIRSTVPPGFSDTAGVHFMPEFLTEKHWENDFYNQKKWYFGIPKGATPESITSFQEKIRTMIRESHAHGNIAHSGIQFVANAEAEMMKYVRNTYLATKVGFFNEIASLCKAKGIEYENVRQMTVEDPRITESHTHVPGHDGFTGFGGTCFPKDISSLCNEFSLANVPALILPAVKHRNDTIDRPGRDWHEKGRSVV